MLTWAFSAFICANSKISFRVKEGKALNTLATQIINQQAKMIVKIIYQLAISYFSMVMYMSHSQMLGKFEYGLPAKF